MFLAIDIGNSGIKCGVFDAGELISTFEMGMDASASIAAYRHSLRGRLSGLTPTSAGISSVVPSMTATIAQAVRDEFMVMAVVIGPGVNPPFASDYAPPGSLGADRLSAAAAAFTKYGLDDIGQTRPLLIIDAGTAVTYDVVFDGVHKGGAIAPGPTLAARALANGTGNLPHVDTSMPAHGIADCTVDGIRSGVMFGFVDSVSGMIGRIATELDIMPFVVTTGGGGAFLATHIKAVDVFDPQLVLEGIAQLSRQMDVD